MGDLMRRRAMMAAVSGGAVETPLFPLPDGSYSFSAGSITTSNGNHVVFVRTTGGTTNTYATIYPLTLNTSNITSSNNANRSSTTWFHLNAGDEVTISIKNNTSNSNVNHTMWLGLKGVSSGSVNVAFDTGSFKRNLPEYTVTKTISEDVDIGSLMIYMQSWSSTQTFDIFLYVNGVRFI